MSDIEGTSPVDAGERPRATGFAEIIAAFRTYRPSRIVIVAGGAIVLALAIALGWTAFNARRDTPPDSPEVAALTKRVTKNPEDVRSRVDLGFVYESKGRLDLALHHYNRALVIEPNNTAALFNRGRVYLVSGLDDKAEEAMWDVLEIEPDHVQAAILLGKIYAGRKQFRSLDVAVRPVADRNPHVAELQYLSGLAAERAGNGPDAIARYKKALLDDPDLVEARDGLDRLGVVAE